jgi:hypothetical protein
MLGKIFLVAVLLPQCTMERVVIDATDASTMRSSFDPTATACTVTLLIDYLMTTSPRFTDTEPDGRTRRAR